jgi:hypothetical protein
MKVIFVPEVRLYLQELAHILYLNNYFGSNDSARNYVIELWNDIVNDLPCLYSKEAPSLFDRYGQDMFCATFRKSRHTYWHVFFDKYSQDGETVYLVRFIGNNHTIAQYL